MLCKDTKEREHRREKETAIQLRATANELKEGYYEYLSQSKASVRVRGGITSSDFTLKCL